MGLRRSLFGLPAGALILLVTGCGPAFDEASSSSDEVVSDDAPRVTRQSNGAFRLSTKTPARVDACTGCKDADGDGLSDAWEAEVLEKLRPALAFDEDEPLLGKKGKDHKLAILGRVFPTGSNHVVANILFLYTHDYGAQNPLCFHAESHAGDVERVALDLELSGDGGEAVVTAAYTTGHEGTEDDQSVIWKGKALAELSAIEDPKTGDPRWQVFPSQAKHATYGTVKQCQNAHFPKLTHRFCLDEDCAPDRVSDPERFIVLPAFANAGELADPMTDDLDALGFPGERAWNDERFCGGQQVSEKDREHCPPSVKSKLLSNPFAK